MLAPAFGIALVGFVAYPLYRLVGPIQGWSGPAALALSFLALPGIWLQRHRLTLPGRGDLVALAAVLLCVCTCLSVPFLVGGISRVIFSANPSDALTYLTLADSVTHVDWATLWAGRAPEVSPEAAALLAQSDTALYSARFLALPIRLATMIDLGWFAYLAAIPLERLSLAFATTMAMATAVAGLGLQRIFDLDRRVAALGALVMALGYWAALLRGYDAHSQSQALPIFIALMAVRIAAVPGRQFLSGFLLAGLVCIYTEFAVVMVLLVLCETCLFLFRGRRVSADVAEPMGSAAVAALFLLLSGQAAYLWQVVRGQFVLVAASARAVGSSPFSRDLVSHPFSLLDGAAWAANGLLGTSLQSATWLLEAASILAALWLAIAMLHVAFRGERSEALLATPVLLVVPMCLFALFVEQDEYVFFKLFSTAYPALVACFAVFAFRRAVRRPAVRALGFLAAGFFLAVQSIYVGLWTWAELQARPIDAPRQRYALDYAMEPMLAKLDEVRPRNLLVYLPPSEQWQQAALWEFQLKRFRPFPQAGYLFDNRPPRLQHPAMRREAPFDHALMENGSDYLRGTGIAIPLFADRGLTLYRIVQDSPMLHEYRP